MHNLSTLSQKDCTTETSPILFKPSRLEFMIVYFIILLINNFVYYFIYFPLCYFNVNFSLKWAFYKNYEQNDFYFFFTDNKMDQYLHKHHVTVFVWSVSACMEGTV
jgi:hypothetical protein